MGQIEQIMAKAALNTYSDGWNMANPAGRQQALEEAKSVRQALSEAGYRIVKNTPKTTPINECF